MGHVGPYGHRVPEFVSTPQAAKTIGVTSRTLTRYVERGLLTPAVVLPSGHYRWDLEQLRDQMAQVRRRHRDQP